MQRRSFVKASLITGSMVGLLPGYSRARGKRKALKLEWYELKVYTLKNETQQRLVEDYYKNAAIPALNRTGSNHIGVFTELKPEGQTKIYCLIPFNSLEDVSTVPLKLAEDTAYKNAAAAYLDAPATAPAYERVESSLLQALQGMPKLNAPANKPRIFELRRYESPSEAAGKKKIEMFNTAGEIEIFKKNGLRAVFFGETIIGGLQPNLTYMLTYDDMAEHDKAWHAFSGDPAWKKISSQPEYTDAKLISRITATFLVPTDFSQI